MLYSSFSKPLRDTSGEGKTEFIQADRAEQRLEALLPPPRAAGCLEVFDTRAQGLGFRVWGCKNQFSDLTRAEGLCFRELESSGFGAGGMDALHYYDSVEILCSV